MVHQYLNEAIEVVINNNEILLKGVLNFNTTPKVLRLLKNHLKRYTFPSKTVVILDLASVTQSDSSGLALMTGLLRESKKNNFLLEVKNVPEKLLHLSHLSGLSVVLPFH